MPQIARTDADSLMPEVVSREIIQGVPAQSLVLSRFRRLPNMPRAITRMPVLSTLPTAYFVGEVTRPQTTAVENLKQTANAAWGDKYLNAEEIAVIVPVPESVIDDADYPIWDEVKPWIAAAFGAVIDGAVLFGTNAPTAWPDDIVTDATAAGNVVALGTGTDIYDDIMGEDGVLAKVEACGFGVTGHMAAMSMKSKLRGLRSTTEKLPIFVRSMQEGVQYELDGSPMVFSENGAWDATAALMISGAFAQGVYAMRSDLTFKVLTEAVIQDPTSGSIIYNLAQQDMVALRCTMRLAWNVPNPINMLQPTEASRYPFAILTPADGS